MTKADETVTIKAVAILGAGGMMGQGMARNAAAADIAVNAWNRTESKLDELAMVENVATFATAREAVDGADVIVTMLSDVDATIAAMRGPDGGAAGSASASSSNPSSTRSANGRSGSAPPARAAS
jgi:3-hydroxyisobutyrate dehydrogenase-like beta-hydroxyacid dehydrogenase